MTDKVFFDIGINNEYVGRIMMGLNDHSQPWTVENFRALCTGTKDASCADQPLWYNKLSFYHTISSFMYTFLFRMCSMSSVD